MSRTVRLGAFILGTLLILALGIFIIGGKQYLFTPTYQIKADFANVAGLSQGADVLIGGVHCGTVKSIELPTAAGGKITVDLLLDASTRRIVKQDSVASIETEGLLGNEYVALSFGSVGKPQVKDGETIASIPPLQMAQLLDKANGLLSQGQAAMVNINQVAEHLNSVTGKIDHGDGTVGALVNDKALYNNLDETASNARAAAISAKAGVSDFADNMEALKHNFLLRGFFKNRGYEDSSDLGKDAIESLPQTVAVQAYTFESKDLFDKKDSAKLKGQKALKAAGEYLAGNEFGLAVIEVSTGTMGGAGTDKTLAEGRALVLRDYLVQHFGFDDSKLKTIAQGKVEGEVSKDDWGLVKLLVYPPGTPIPAAPSEDGAPTSPAAHP